MKKYGRIDANQHEIAAGLRKVGCEVLSLAAMGNGCPDLLVNHAGQLTILEVKDGDKPPSRQKLTPHQIKFKQRWPVHVVRNLDEAIQAVWFT